MKVKERLRFLANTQLFTLTHVSCASDRYVSNTLESILTQYHHFIFDVVTA